MTIDDIDIYRSAKLLTDKYGDDAAMIRCAAARQGTIFGIGIVNCIG